jgi:hypothetical protein
MLMWLSLIPYNYGDTGFLHTSPSLLTYHQNKSDDLAHWNKHIHSYINPQSYGITTLLDQLFMQHNSPASPSMFPGHIQNEEKYNRHVTDSKVLCT